MTIGKRLRLNILASLAVSVLLAMTGPMHAQDSVEALLDRLRAIQDNQNASAVELKSATIIVDRIVKVFPASEAAVSILYEETYQGIDFKSFESRLVAALQAPAKNPAQTLTAPVQPGVQSASHLNCIANFFVPHARVAMQVSVSTDPNGAITELPKLLIPELTNSSVRRDYLGLALAIENCAPLLSLVNPAEHVFDISDNGAIRVLPKPGAAPAVAASGLAAFPLQGSADPQSIPGFPFTSAQTETEIKFNRTAIRDLQARLLVMGFDPNGIDGSLGKGARSAISAWQASIGVETTGYLNPPQLEHLKTLSEENLSVWLLEPANAAKYNKVQKKRKKKRRVRACKRNAIGVLYDCRYVWR